ncbi:MAG: MDR family MFS transporter, partial [Candidatus Promineifilaceae bacterium]
VPKTNQKPSKPIKMLSRVKNLSQEFPRTFWVLTGATFIDQVGGWLLFPFFALYVTEHFGVGMTEVGILFAIFSIANLIGGVIGGALTDKLGRKWMLMFGLIASASSSLLMAVVNDLVVFYGLAVIVGLLTTAGGPAQQAMVADILPEKKQAEGYGLQRVSLNLAAAIGPAIGGLLAGQSFLLLFVTDAVSSIITAVIVYFALPETKPQAGKQAEQESLVQSIKGYRTVLQDSLFMTFWLVSTLAVLAYSQVNSTLSVYLRDVHGLTAQSYGYLLSLNAAMVVLFQFWVTRRVSKFPAMLMMAAGSALYGIGFGMIGFVSGLGLFAVAMIIVTIGEMIIIPVAQALVARLAPEDKRGRYMAAFGFTWTIPFAIGPLLAGLIMDNLNPDLVWYLSGLIGLIAAAGYLWLQLRGAQRVGPALETENQ